MFFEEKLPGLLVDTGYESSSRWCEELPDLPAPSVSASDATTPKQLIMSARRKAARELAGAMETRDGRIRQLQQEINDLAGAVGERDACIAELKFVCDQREREILRISNEAQTREDSIQSLTRVIQEKNQYIERLVSLRRAVFGVLKRLRGQASPEF